MRYECADCKKVFLHVAKIIDYEPTNLNDLEELATLEHEQWMDWSKRLASEETISTDRLERWKTCWVPYKELTETDKEQDRKWAKQIDLMFRDKQIQVCVCPYCRSLNLLEHVEVEPAITSVKSVDLAEVDTLLKEGYVVHELYAKNAVLIKKEA